MTKGPGPRQTYENGKSIQNLQRHIQNKISGPGMKQYLYEKNGWEEDTFLNFDWDAIEMALNSYKPYKLTKVAQLMYRWQYVGERKETMRDGGSVCPTGCGEMEESLHYLYRTSRDMTKRRQKHYTLLVMQLKALHTYPGIIAVVTKALRQE